MQSSVFKPNSDAASDVMHMGGEPEPIRRSKSRREGESSSPGLPGRSRRRSSGKKGEKDDHQSRKSRSKSSDSVVEIGSQMSEIMKLESETLAMTNISTNEFANLKNLDDIIKKLSTRLCKPEDLLIDRGNDSDNIYFLSKGIVEIYIDDPR